MTIAEKLKLGIPKQALQFAGEVTGEAGKDGIKVHLKARSKEPINHWYFGSVAHDFSTMTLPSKFALDDSHDVEIGYARASLTAWGLEADGVVFPNEDNPEHESNRIAYNLKNGIPQQSSIDFSGDYDLLEIPDGMSYPCNGNILSGPALIIQNWTLKALAICKLGADPNTETTAQFKADSPMAKAPRSVTTLSQSLISTTFTENKNLSNKESLNMDKTTPKVDEVLTVSTVATETVVADTAAVKPEALTAAPVVVKADEGVAVAPVAPKTELQAAQPVVDAKDTTITELTAKVAELETKLTALSVSTKPIVTAEAPGKSLWTQYKELTDLAERTRFYQANKKAMDTEALTKTSK